jgi:DNA-directed RNA polymerase subunit RPC12/RpoP
LFKKWFELKRLQSEYLRNQSLRGKKGEVKCSKCGKDLLVTMEDNELMVFCWDCYRHAVPSTETLLKCSAGMKRFYMEHPEAKKLMPVAEKRI